jgi:hypothetical protein
MTRRSGTTAGELVAQTRRDLVETAEAIRSHRPPLSLVDPPPTEILLYLGWCGRPVLPVLPVLSAFSLSPPPHQGLSDRQRMDEQARRAVQSAKPHTCVLGSLATVGVLRPLMVSRRGSVGQLRGPPFGRDDPHREVEGAPIERLRELGDSDGVVA